MYSGCARLIASSWSPSATMTQEGEQRGAKLFGLRVYPQAGHFLSV
jgi:hypothetical protein